MNRPMVWAAASAAALGLLVCACGESEGGNASKNGASAGAVAVRWKALEPTSFAETIQLTGVVKAVDDVLISPEEGGVVKRWNAVKGQYVERGAVIVELDDAVARPGYEAALAQYNTARLNYEKQQSVYAEMAVSEMQLRSAQYARDAAGAQAELMKARYERTRIKSPVSGILDDRLVDEGEMAAPGVPIARVVGIGSVKLAVNVPERLAGRIVRGIPVEFSVMALPGETFRGTIGFVGSAISPDNRTFPVEAVLRNPGGKLKPEMIARVNVIQAVRKGVLALPEEIIQRLDRDRLVVYVEQGGKAVEKEVRLGGRARNIVEIVSGLAPGDRVIMTGYQQLVDGQPVAMTE